MGFDFKKWAFVGLHMAEAFFPALAAIESTARAIGGLTGKQKQDAAVQIIRDSVSLAEQAGVFDHEVEQAVREAIDAAVHLQNVIAQKVADKAAADANT